MQQQSSLLDEALDPSNLTQISRLSVTKTSTKTSHGSLITLGHHCCIGSLTDAVAGSPKRRQTEAVVDHFFFSAPKSQLTRVLLGVDSC